MDLINFNNKNYPLFQSEGFASQFAIPFAKYFCKGIGYDIGCNRVEWSLPGSIPIDPIIDNRYNATNLPTKNVDYIFSSHCLEHLKDWVSVLDYWYDSLKEGGVIFLYLPHYSQEYWRPWNNRKHLNILNQEILTNYFEDKGMKNIFSSGVDLNNSFMIVAEK